MVNTNQQPYVLVNPYGPTPAYMMQTSNLTTLPLMCNDMKDTWLHTFCELKDDIVKAICEQEEEIFSVNTPSQNQAAIVTPS